MSADINISETACACGRHIEKLFDGRASVRGWYIPEQCFACREPAPTCGCGAELDPGTDIYDEGSRLRWSTICQTCRSFIGYGYVNAYSVTRHYGGSEEGGWWQNHGEPLASVPVPAIVKAGNVVAADEAAVRVIEDQLRAVLAERHVHGNIYSVRGGVELSIGFEDHIARSWPEAKPHYE